MQVLEAATALWCTQSTVARTVEAAAAAAVEVQNAAIAVVDAKKLADAVVVADEVELASGAVKIS